MKKYIKYMFIISALFSIIILFNKEDYLTRNKMLNYEKEMINSKCIVITTPYDAQKECYEDIVDMLDKYHANLFYSYFYINKFSQKVYVKYIYLNNQAYLNTFLLSEGTYFDLNKKDEYKYIATTPMGDPHQQGRIIEFGQNDTIFIKSLISMIEDKVPIRGKFIIQVDKQFDFKDFIEELNTINNISVNQQNLYLDDPYMFPYEWIIVIFCISIGLMCFYDLLMKYKNMGIQKMQGYSTKDIWKDKIKTIIFQQLLIYSVIYSVGTLILFKEINKYSLLFAQKLCIIFVIIILSNIICISIPCLYINKIRIVDIIKNKVPFKKIFITNTVIKTVCCIISILLIRTIVTDYSIVKDKFNKSYSNWEMTKDYVIIPSIGNITHEEIISDDFRNKQKKLFLYFNKKGSLLSDFSDYRPINPKYRTCEKAYQIKAEVNPNYLKNYPLYDENGNRIKINEEDEDYIMLIPSQYKGSEKEIIRYYAFIKAGYGEDSIVSTQKLKIIWTQEGQSLFSYLIDLNPNQSNMVSEPVIRVITEKNGDMTDYDKIMGYCDNPYKIKLDHSENPYYSLNKALAELNLDKNIVEIYSVYSEVAATIQEKKERIAFTILGIMILLLFVVGIIYQNIYLYIESNKRKLAVKLLHGYSKRSRYGSYISFQSMSWGSVIGILILLGQLKGLLLCGIIILLLSFECLLSIMCISLFEKVKILKFLKGGE